MPKAKPKIALFFLLIFFISSPFLIFADESITISTYYPSPYGSYKELGWGDYPNSRGKLTSDQGASIELGGSGTPYIDFSNDMTSDYDVRIRLIDDHTLAVEGGVLTGAVGCISYTFTVTSGTQTCPSGYQIPIAPVTPADTSGTFLCCRYT